MKVAVSGASGYVGQALLMLLARQGASTLALARSKPLLPALDGVRWLLCADGEPSASQLVGIDAVVHLAGRAHTRVAFANGRDLFDGANHRLAVRMALAAQRAGVGRFVFVSTLGVHGNWSDSAVREDSPIRAETPYARSKWAAEQALLRSSEASGMDLCIVRPPMVYGPRCPGNFTRLVKLVRMACPLPFASVNAQRSFVYVENLASFLVHCAEHVRGRQTFVIGDGSDWELPQLIRTIGAALDVPVRLFPFPLPVLRLAAQAAGRQREIDSLTRSMTVDWAHVRNGTSWRPPIPAVDALQAALKSDVF